MTIDKTIEAIEVLPDAAECCVIRYTGDRIEPFADAPDLKALAAELKELREFVGAMHNCVLADGAFCCEVDDGVWHLTDVHDDLLASGTDPFDAWRKMNAGEGE